MRNRQRASAVLLVIPLLAAAAASSPPAVPPPLAVEELLDAPTLAPFGPPAFSPDNRLLAYVVTDNARRREAIDPNDLDRNGLGWFGVASDVWISDLASGARRNLTGGVGDNWSPAWSPDGRRLAFLSDRGSGGKALGPARLWVWERGSGALRQASDADVREGFAGLHWTADSRSVLAALFPADLGRERWAALVGSRSATPAAPGAVSAKVFDYDPAAAGGPGTDQVSPDIIRFDLGVVDVETGKLRRVVSGQRVSGYALAADHATLAYGALKGVEKAGTGQYLLDVVAVDLASGSSRVVAADVRLDFLNPSISFSPTGDRLAYRTAGPLARDEVFVVPGRGGAPIRVADNPAVDALGLTVIDPAVWDVSGRYLFFLRGGVLWRAAADGSGASAFATLPGHELGLVEPRGGRLFSPDGRSAVLMATNPATKRVGFAKVDLATGATSILFEEDKRYGGYGTDPSISPDGASVAYAAEDAFEPADLFVLGGDPARPRKVSRVAPSLARRPLGKSEMIEWRGVDGDTLRGAIVYPAGYERGNRYPLIVKVYGGSAISNDLNRFGYALAAVENLQLYATRGYALLLADSKLNLGTPVADLVKSVMPGVDRAVELGVADPDRVGITGHSYGGYSTLALIARTTRFRAAVMRAGLGDLIGMYGSLMPDGTNYGLAWAESGQGRMGGSPWEFRDRYIENSAIFSLDRVRTPLLIIHGGADRAVPVYMADEVFSGLRRLGQRVAYRRYEGEDHWEGTWSRANQVDALEHAIAWFDRYLKGGKP